MLITLIVIIMQTDRIGNLNLGKEENHLIIKIILLLKNTLDKKQIPLVLATETRITITITKVV
jgi:hypothetical protein